jgi:hypothetical protein
VALKRTISTVDARSPPVDRPRSRVAAAGGALALGKLKPQVLPPVPPVPVSLARSFSSSSSSAPLPTADVTATLLLLLASSPPPPAPLPMRVTSTARLSGLSLLCPPCSCDLPAAAEPGRPRRPAPRQNVTYSTTAPTTTAQKPMTPNDTPTPSLNPEEPMPDEPSGSDGCGAGPGAGAPSIATVTPSACTPPGTLWSTERIAKVG